MYIHETPMSNEIIWYLYVKNRRLGWCPRSLFNNLQSNVDSVDFGGKVYFNSGLSGSQFNGTKNVERTITLLRVQSLYTYKAHKNHQ